MANLFQFFVRKTQPPTQILAEAKWRAKKLRCLYLPFSKSIYDLSGNNRTSTNTSCTATLDTDVPGRVWNFGTGSATSRIFAPTLALNGIGGVTWVAMVYATDVTNNTIANCDSGDFGTAATGVSLRVSSGQLQILLPGLAIPATGPTITTGKWYVIAMRYTAGNGTSGCAATFAVDGVLTAGAALDNTAPSNDAGATPLIGAQANNVRNWQGKIAMFANFDSLLTDAELVSLTQNPWQMFPVYDRAMWPQDAAGGVIAKIGAMRHSYPSVARH